jgi:HlyD family secretion protein
MKRRTGLYVTGAIIILVAAVIILNLTLRGSRYETALPTRVTTVARGTLEDRVSGNGTFVPRSTVTVVAQVSGEVQSVRVTENDRVQAGQVLLTLRSDDYVLTQQKTKASLDSTRRSVRQSLLTLRSQYRSAVSALADAKRTFEKNKELYATRAISEEVWQRSSDAVDAASVGWQSAREQLDLRCGLALDAEPPMDAAGDDAIVEASPEVEQALLSLKSATDAVARCTITAPAAGTVTRVTPSIGDVVAPSTPLVKIEDLGDMLAEIQVDEVDIGKIHVGQAAEITSDSLIGVTLRGIVDTISPTITSLGATRASLVDVRIDRSGLASGQVLRSGASCTARVTTSTRKDALLVPLAGFLTENNVSAVFVLGPTGKKNGAGADIFQLSKKEITTGVSDVNSIEVLTGLAEGDRIAAGNLKLLRDGILVTIKPE